MRSDHRDWSDPVGSTQGGIQMADRASRYSGGWEEQATPSPAIGLILFAAVMMFQFDITTWGWIHLILGIVVALAGVGLLAGRSWARVVGITLAVLSAIANFMFIPHYPFWALLVIALDVFVIWALAAHGGELRDASA
jgi:hypothetical protein